MTILLLRGTIVNRTYGRHKNQYMTILLLRGIIVNRTYGRHKNQYIYLFSLTIWSYLLWSPVTLTINRVSSDGILVNEDGYGILGGEKEKRTLSRNRGVCVCRHNSTRVNAERRYQRKARNLPSGREGDISCFVTSDLGCELRLLIPKTRELKKVVRRH